MNYLRNKYNIFRRLLNTPLYCSVKQKFQNVAIALPLLGDKVVNSTI